MTKAFQASLDVYRDIPLSQKIKEASNMIRKYYIEDERPFVLAYSGGKDSNALLYLAMNTLLEMQKDELELKKEISVVTSNTMAELPPMLRQIKKSLNEIKKFAQKNKLPVKVYEVLPKVKNTLNVQFLGVGMPPPNGSFRWCTDKLKKLPSDNFIVKHYKGKKGFITLTGSRRAESFDRASALVNASRAGTDLKFNSRYVEASNLTPIEHWTVKDVWSYLFMQNNSITDMTFLWDLYSDASGKESSECSFVGAGGKEIDEGKIGCGVSRFGCWQCFIVRGEDKALGGLLKSGYKNIDLYVEYRNWFWNLTQQGWHNVRDVYRHDTFGRKMYLKGGMQNPKFGMTQARGLRLAIRMASFKRIIKLQSKVKDTLITLDEIIEIQRRWLYEGDLNLTAFKIYVGDLKVKQDELNELIEKEFQPLVNKALKFIQNELSNMADSKEYSKITIQRKAVQMALGKKVEKQFYPTKDEECTIRKQWKNGALNHNEQIKAMEEGVIKIDVEQTLFGKNINRETTPIHLMQSAQVFCEKHEVIDFKA